MLNAGKLDGHSITLFRKKTHDHCLELMFQLVASDSSSLIVLEDINFAYVRMPSEVALSKVSFLNPPGELIAIFAQCSLNSLDLFASTDSHVFCYQSNAFAHSGRAEMTKIVRWKPVSLLSGCQNQLRDHAKEARMTRG